MNYGYIAFVVPGLLLVALVCFFVSRYNSPIAPAIEHRGLDTEGLTADSSLLTWVRRSSRGRFADTHGSRHDLAPEKHHRFSLSTLFVRSSLVPHVASVNAPPGHQSLPTVSSPLAGPPLPIQIPAVPRVFIPALRSTLRSVSGPTLPSVMSTLHPQIAARSVSDSDSTLYPSSTMIKRLPSVPSRALLLASETHGLNVIIAQGRTDASLPVGRIVTVSGEGAFDVRSDNCY